MFEGPATVIITADDVDAAGAWYAELLGQPPYFRREAGGGTAYLEFRIGDAATELGLLDRRFASWREGSGDPLVHWSVPDLHGALARLLELGATEVEPITERGDGFTTAVVADPFGNVFAVMTNPHYRQVWDELR